MTLIPVTLGTAGILGLLYLYLTARVVMGRASNKVMIGDGTDKEGAKDLLVAIRSHANFAEYVPLALILLGGIEAAGASRFVCQLLALLLIVGRVLHPIGMARKAPNPFRAGGAMLTWVMIGLASLEAVFRAL